MAAAGVFMPLWALALVYIVAHVLSLLSFDRFIMGKVEIGIYFCVTADILTKV